MISQAALSITHSPVHTVDYYLGVVEKLVEYGTDEICLKDMAGVGRPTEIGQIVAGIKKKHPQIKVQYHGHTGPGFSPASMLEAARAGADYLDCAVEPLSWGKVHPDVISMQQMMKADGFLAELLKEDKDAKVMTKQTRSNDGEDQKIQTSHRKALDFSTDNNGDTTERSRTIKTTKRM